MRRSSSGASCCMFFRMGFNAFAITDSWPTATAQLSLPAAASCFLNQHPRSNSSMHLWTTATATSNSPVNRCVPAPSAVMGAWFASKPSSPALCLVRHRAITHELQHTIAAECFSTSLTKRWSSFRLEWRIHAQFLRQGRIGHKTTQRNRPKHDSRPANQRSGRPCQLLASVSLEIRRDRADSIPIAPRSARWFSTTGFLANRTRWRHHGTCQTWCATSARLKTLCI